MKTGSVIKQIALLSMVAALAVAMVACQGAVGPKGDTGAKGEPGAPGKEGPKGDPGTDGTSDNDPPTVKIPLNSLHLVVGGGARPAKGPTTATVATSVGYGSVVIDLDKHFTDTEAPALDYQVTSSDAKVAEVSPALVRDGMLTVTAVGTAVGKSHSTATIALKVHDGVNDPVDASFDVVVAKTNTAPAVTGVTGIADLIDTGDPAATPPTDVRNKLYFSAGTITRTFDATIDPGSINGQKEVVDFRVVVGDGMAGTAVVTVSKPTLVGTPASEVGNRRYSVGITAVKSNVPAATPVTVTIIALDSFHAETIVDQFDVIVNTRPLIAVPLPDIILVRSGTGTTALEALSARTSGGDQLADYTLSRYFDVEMLNVVPAGGATDVLFEDDTTCSFATSPAQPTGRTYDATRAATVGPTASDPIKATSLASVSAFDGSTETWAMLTGGGAKVTVNSAAAATTTLEDTVTSAAAAGTGMFTLTITCSDQDKTISDSATITVRP